MEIIKLEIEVGKYQTPLGILNLIEAYGINISTYTIEQSPVSDALPDSKITKVGDGSSAKGREPEPEGGVGGEVMADGRTTAGAFVDKRQPTRGRTGGSAL